MEPYSIQPQTTESNHSSMQLNLTCWSWRNQKNQQQAGFGNPWHLLNSRGYSPSDNQLSQHAETRLKAVVSTVATYP